MNAGRQLQPVRFIATLTLGAACLGAGGLCLTPRDGFAAEANGTVQVPSMALPESSFLGEESRAALKNARDRDKAESASACQPIERASREQAPAIRRCEIDSFYKSALYKALRERYHVSMKPQMIAGIYTEVYLPADGVAAANRERVLINVHGGGFVDGSRIGSQLESVPIAAVARIKIISIDYRQAPEYAFPSASEDVATVYRELLKTYPPQRVGIFGCSAGGLLTAESMAWFQKEKLPLPGAIAMLCEGAGYWTEGDTGEIGKKIIGDDPIWGASSRNPYFKQTRADDPLAFPVRSPAILSKFPPTLLISSTRDTALSSVVHTHSVLIAQGVDAQLHIWEGLEHAFMMDAALPESREVYSVVAKFFDRHLAASQATAVGDAHSGR